MRQSVRPSQSNPEPPPATALKIVGIGASAGGLEAFTELLANLPTEAAVAYVLVQHLDPTHRSLLSELLGRAATLPVREIGQRMRVEPRQIYVIPPNRDLTIHGGVLTLTVRAKNSGPARTIDHFLESLAQDQKEHAIGVILSGAGSDGAKGLAAIKQAGGITFAQDQASAKYDSMPRSAIATGCVDFVLSPAKIAAEIGRILRQPRRTRRRAAANTLRRRTEPSAASTRRLERLQPGKPAWPVGPEDLNLRKLFVLLRSRTGTDFSFYRPNTVRRRLARRLALHKLKGLEAYARFVREHPAELDDLYQDLLINVTAFFRNPGVFDGLKKRVFPKLVRAQPAGEPLRFWVAGCSTGQEAFSLAMIYAEFAEENSVAVPVQIFATDLNNAVLEQARAARFTKAQVEGVSAARLQRFFTKEPDGYRVAKPIRDLVLFAQHNLLSDPPFTRVDLISCRNLLIYFESALQQRIIPTFHYALRPSGYLLLGSSESVGQFANLFDPVARSQKLFAKKPGANWVRYERPPALPTTRLHAATKPAPARPPEAAALDALREADRILLAKYAPAGVLVNAEGEILQFRGETQRYLELPSGKASFNVFKMAREGLGTALQKALQRAQRDRRVVHEKDVRLGGRRGPVNFDVVPLKHLATPAFLILFASPPAAPAAAAAAPRRGAKADAGDGRRVAELRREQADLREQLASLREMHDTSTEELQASNEEVQSANEELQSLNEELETSNEELESANEELTTLNEELATRNAELRNSELRLREQAEMLELAPVLARSLKERIIFWNRGAEKLYGFSREDAIGQTAHILLNAQFPEPLEKIQAQLQRHGHWEGEVLHRRKNGQIICVTSQWVLHHDAEGRPRAVLEVNADITDRRQAEQALRDSEEFNRRILESTPDCVTIVDLEGRLTFINGAGLQLLELDDATPAERAYWPGFWEAGSRTDAEKAYRAALHGRPARFRGLWPTWKGTPKWWDVALRPMLGPEGKPQRILAIARDVTEQRQAETAAREEARLAHLRAQIALSVARGGDLEEVLQEIADRLMQQLDGALVRIWTLGGEPAHLELRATAGLNAPAEDPLRRIPSGVAPIGSIASEKKPWVSADLAAGDPPGFGWLRKQGLVAGAGYPLLLEGHLLGVVALFGARPLEPRALTELSHTADAIAQLIGRKRDEDERARLYDDAVAARNEALAASRAKDDFLAALSHELRTPLNPVLMLASDGADNPGLPEAVRATFRTIATNVSLEARLIDDLLDLTRIAHGKMSLELRPVDAHAPLRDALGVVAADVEAKQITLSVRLEATRTTVVGDGVRLQQVFWNVLTNAVKFTPRGGRIDVHSQLGAGGDRLLVCITDSGIGLADGDAERIFSAFSQGAHRLGGLGLGLAISRQLLEKHGGTIRATSDGAGKGAVFEIELPLAGLTARTAAADGHLPPAFQLDGHTPAAADGRRSGDAPARRPRILLIEDHEATRTSLVQLLGRRDFDVVAAASAEEARAQVQAGAFDLVISDLGLPDCDGCTLWSQLRSQRPELVGIALSGYGMEDDIARSRAAGFAHHLTKPVNIKALDRAIAIVAALPAK